MATLLAILLDLCATVYGGTVITFAVLFVVFPRATRRPEAWLARVWRSVGPILGLSMGGQVLGLLGLRYLERGEIRFGWATPADQLDLVTWVAFLALWSSSFILEIWTMDPLRAAVDDDDQPRDGSGFLEGYRATRRHLVVNAALVVVWHTLRTLAG